MSFLQGYKIITITHHNLNVDELGNFIVSHSDDFDLQSKLQSLTSKHGISELIYLATCNRVSFICYSNETFDTDYLMSFFKSVSPDLPENLLHRIPKFAEVYVGRNAIEHLFEVASSMDSLVVGEREIFRQFRQAYNKAVEFGLVGDNLRVLERNTVTTAKSVYDQTRIGEKPLSIVSLAMQHMDATNLPENPRILIVGAGETNTLVGKFLKKKAYNRISIFNRSLDNAEKLSGYLEASAYHLTDLHTFDEGFDVMIVCTAATDPIITLPIYKQLLQKSEDNKLVIDLSVPANVAGDVVSTYDTMDYVDIEKLRHRAEENLRFRKKEVICAKSIIQDSLEDFTKVYQQRQLEKAMKDVPKEIKKVKERALDIVYKDKVAALDQPTQALIYEMMTYMEKKCVSVPIKAAKSLVK